MLILIVSLKKKKTLLGKRLKIQNSILQAVKHFLKLLKILSKFFYSKYQINYFRIKVKVSYEKKNLLVLK